MITFIDKTGEIKSLDKKGFQKLCLKSKEEKRQTRIKQAEKKMRDKIMAEQKKTVLAPAYSKSEKDTERRNIAKMLSQGFINEDIKILPTGKTGEFVIRMPQSDYTIKLTAKKERQEILD